MEERPGGIGEGGGRTWTLGAWPPSSWRGVSYVWACILGVSHFSAISVAAGSVLSCWVVGLSQFCPKGRPIIMGGAGARLSSYNMTCRVEVRLSGSCKGSCGQQGPSVESESTSFCNRAVVVLLPLMPRIAIAASLAASSVVRSWPIGDRWSGGSSPIGHFSFQAVELFAQGMPNVC